MEAIYKPSALKHEQEKAFITNFFLVSGMKLPFYPSYSIWRVLYNNNNKKDSTSYTQLHVCLSLQIKALPENTEEAQPAAAACNERFRRDWEETTPIHASEV